MRILFTCLGNICRSPMAEGILKTKIKERNLNWHVASNGTNHYHKGGPADERAVIQCKREGIDISQHIAVRFKTQDFDKYDLIICMANDVYSQLQQFVTDKKQLDKVIVKEFKDPWYGGQDGFEDVFNSISDYLDECIEKWVAKPGY